MSKYRYCLFFVALLFLAIVAGVVLPGSERVSEDAQVSSEVLSPRLDRAVTETDGWLVFERPDHGFQFRYPADGMTPDPKQWRIQNYEESMKKSIAPHEYFIEPSVSYYYPCRLPKDSVQNDQGGPLLYQGSTTVNYLSLYHAELCFTLLDTKWLRIGVSTRDRNLNESIVDGIVATFELL